MAPKNARQARRDVVGACLAIGLASVGRPLWAQPLGDNNILKMVVPSPPGGTTDILGRILTDKLGARLKQPAITENRPGAGGNIGAAVVAKAKPDGNTLLFTAVTTPAISYSLYSNLQYDVLKDLVPVAVVGSLPLVLLVRNGLPVKNTAELLKLAKQNPGKINFGSAGTGTTAHFTGEFFKITAGIDVTHVPYKGNGPALADVVGEHLDMMFDFLPSALQLVKAGKLRALGVSSPVRSPALPDVPTLAESGVPGFEVLSYFGVMAPAGTPNPVIEKLNSEINGITTSAENRARYEAEGVDPAAETTEWFAKYLNDEIVRWKKVIQQAKVKVQ
jgi:tripartite-type tricarboxylate transporter receptor subunit TctC